MVCTLLDRVFLGRLVGLHDLKRGLVLETRSGWRQACHSMGMNSGAASPPCKLGSVGQSVSPKAISLVVLHCSPSAIAASLDGYEVCELPVGNLHATVQQSLTWRVPRSGPSRAATSRPFSDMESQWRSYPRNFLTAPN